MNELQERIMNYVSDHPGTDKSSVARSLGVKFLSSEFRAAWHDLYLMGILRREVHEDHVEMRIDIHYYVVAP